MTDPLTTTDLARDLRSRASARNAVANAILWVIAVVIILAGVLIWFSGTISKSELDIEPLKVALGKIEEVSKHLASAPGSMPPPGAMPPAAMPAPPLLPQLPGGSELPATLPFELGAPPKDVQECKAQAQRIQAQLRRAQRDLDKKQKEAQREIDVQQKQAQQKLEARQDQIEASQRELIETTRIAQSATQSVERALQSRSGSWLLGTALNAFSIRLITAVLALFLVQLLAGVLRFNSLLAAHYNARADALELLDPTNLESVERMSKAMSPDSGIGFGRPPKSPINQASELLKSLMDIVDKTRTK